MFNSRVSRRIGEHWSVNFNVRRLSIEFGERSEIANSDFYLYDVDEPGLGVGFLYHW